MDAVRLSTETPLMLDCKWRGGGPGHTPDHASGRIALQAPGPGIDGKGDDPAFYGKYAAEMAHFVMKRHGDGLNACFFDGSARNLPVYELWGLKWSQNYDPGEALRILSRRGRLPGWLF